MVAGAAKGHVGSPGADYRFTPKLLHFRGDATTGKPEAPIVQSANPRIGDLLSLSRPDKRRMLPTNHPESGECGL
jgi:hypothetical protein